jgi:allantoinase
LRKALKHCFANRLMGRVWKCRPGEIAQYCRTLPPGVIPGS